MMHVIRVLRVVRVIAIIAAIVYVIGEASNAVFIQGNLFCLLPLWGGVVLLGTVGHIVIIIHNSGASLHVLVNGMANITFLLQQQARQNPDSTNRMLEFLEMEPEDLRSLLLARR